MHAKRGWRGRSSCDLASASSFGRRAFFCCVCCVSLFAPLALRAHACTPGESPAGYPRRAPLGAPAKPAEPAAPDRQYRSRAGSPLGAGDPCCIFASACASPGREGMAGSRSRASHRASLRESRPFGLPSLTPTARRPASGLRASLACGRHKGTAVACPAIFPDLITLLATVARGRVPSRRSGPCPRLRLRAAPTLRLSP
jgi:hypothetical protein